jgi:hypothetical protein
LRKFAEQKFPPRRHEGHEVRKNIFLSLSFVIFVSFVVKCFFPNLASLRALREIFPSLVAAVPRWVLCALCGEFSENLRAPGNLNQRD